MNLYWLYDLPNWAFGTIVVFFFLAFGLSGVCLTRNWVRKLHQIDHSHNDIVGYFLSAITVFYGITLGLVTVGTWDTYSQVSWRVDGEAQIIASLYRDVGSYEEPWKSELRQDLKDYTRNVIDISWPLQRKGVIPTSSGKFLDNFQFHLMAFHPTDMSQQIIRSEVFKQFNALTEMRRARLNTVLNGLPMSIWMLVMIGGVVSIVVTMFFDTASFAMHLWMTGLLSALLGLIIFLVATLDCPFRGSVSVGPDALELVYTQTMSPAVQAQETLPWQQKETK